MTPKKEMDFGWGNPYFLLELLDSLYTQKLSPHNIKNMSYAPDDGESELIRITRDMLKTTTGTDYPYITITNGATQAVNSILRLKKSMGYENVVTLPYGYPFYKDMISRVGLHRIESESLSIPKEGKTFRLIDSPSNPLGIQTTIGDDKTDVWDSVYHNEIYTNNLSTIPDHYCLVGSYSKLLGLTGARVGFIASKSVFFHKLAVDWSVKDIATVSIPSQALIVDIMSKIDLMKFTRLGNKYLGYNKEEFQKIEYLFDNQRVQENGMFYCVHVDKKALDLLDRCGIKYVRLTDDYIRISMGQTGQLTREAVKLILRKDGKK